MLRESRTSHELEGFGALAFMLSLSFIVTIGAFSLREQSRFGSFWQKEATDFFEKAVLVRAQHLNSMQASISTTVIEMLSLDTVMSSKFARRLLAGELTRAVADQSRFQLESFSMDCGITSEGCWGGSAFAKDCGNVSSASPLISGYFSKYEPRYECAVEGEGHEVDSAERHVIDHAITKLTAFLDLKFRSLVRRRGGNSTQVQIGLEDSRAPLGARDGRVSPSRHSRRPPPPLLELGAVRGPWGACVPRAAPETPFSAASGTRAAAPGPGLGGAAEPADALDPGPAAAAPSRCLTSPGCAATCCAGAPPPR